MFSSLSSSPDLGADLPCPVFPLPVRGVFSTAASSLCSRFRVHLMTICFDYVSCVLAFVVITAFLSLISIIVFGCPVPVNGYFLFPAAPVIFLINSFFSVLTGYSLDSAALVWTDEGRFKKRIKKNEVGR